MSKASMLKDAERSLAVRVKRIYTVTPKGGPTGTSVELDGARKGLQRATERLARAELAHSVATAEAVEYAEIVTALGGTVDFDSFMPKVEVTDETLASETESTDDDVATDGLQEPERSTGPDETSAEPTNDVETEPDSDVDIDVSKPARSGGRFARRGTVVG